MFLRPDRLGRLSPLAWLTAITAAGLALRLVGVQYGLPDVHNPDEIAIMSRALGFAKGDFNPHNFLYPSLYFYVLFGWIGLSFIAGWLAGAFSSLAAFQTQFFVDPTYVYTAGRLLSVVYGALTIVVTMRLARRIMESSTATWAAAALMAVAPFAVRDAHYVKHDIPVTLAAAVALLVMARWRETPAAVRAALLSGAACGVACSIHYYAVFLAVPLVAVPWLSAADVPARTRARVGALSVIALVVTFFALSPFLLVEPRTAWQDIVANRRIVVDRAVNVGWFGSAGSYGRMLVWEAMGWPAAALAAIGLAALAWRNIRTAVWLVLFPTAFLLFVANTVPATRYVNPVLPVIAVLAAEGIAFAARRVGAAFRAPAVRLPLLVGVLTLAAVTPGLRDSIRTGLFFRQTDTRTLAAEYIRRHVPPGATVLAQAYTVQLVPTRESLVETVEANRGPGSRPSARMARQFELSPYPSPAYRLLVLGDGTGDPERRYLPYEVIDAAPGLDALRAEAVDYVVIKSTAQTPAPLAMLRARLEREARRVMVFSPYAGGAPADGVRPFLHNADARLDQALVRPGPVVELWQLTAVR